MNAAASPSPADLSLCRRFEAFIEALCRCVAAEGAKHRIAGPLVILIWRRLRRLATTFARIVARPPAHRAPHPSGKSGPRHKLPAGYAWLLRLMPATAAIASQLRHMLAQPEMAELIATTPAAGRILRPLCDSLGIRRPPCLRLPPRAKKPRTPSVAPPPASGSPDPARTASPARRQPSRPPPFHEIPGRPRAPDATDFFNSHKFRT